MRDICKNGDRVARMNVAVVRARPAGKTSCQDGTDVTTAGEKECVRKDTVEGLKLRNFMEREKNTCDSWDGQGVHLTGKRLGT